MVKRFFGNLLISLLILFFGGIVHHGCKGKATQKLKRTAKQVKTRNRILIEVAGKSTKLKLGGNPVYVRGPNGNFRIVSYAWGAYSILGYSVPDVSEIFCLSSVRGEESYEVSSNFYVLADIDGDGYEDIACVNKRDRKKLLVFSGKDGSKLRAYVLGDKECLCDGPYAVLATYDHNEDGVKDFFTHTGKSLLLISGNDGKILSTFTFPLYLSKSVSDCRLHKALDMDGDGKEDILFSGGVDIGKEFKQRGIACVYFLSSKTGELINSTPLNVKFAFDDADKHMRSSYLEALAIIDDINKDGFPDLIATDSSDGTPKGCSVLLAISGKDGNEIWRVNGSRIRGGKSQFEDVKRIEERGGYFDARFGNGLIVYPDINGDGIHEVIAGAPQVHNREIKGWGCLLLFSGKDGSLLKQIWLPEAKGYVGTYINTFPDMDRDDLPEIMLGVTSSDIGAGEGGAILVLSSKAVAK